MDTQRQALAKRGIDHDQYEIYLSQADHLDEETTSIMVREKATGKQAEKTVTMSRRQLADDPTGKVYYDVIVELVREIEKQ